MIKVYTKQFCPYCVKAKALLHDLKVEFEEEDLTNQQEKIQELSERSGMLTVPQIFVGDKCLGGYSDIAKLHEEGKLEEMLKS